MQLGRSPVSVSDLVKAGLLQPGQSRNFRKRSDCTAAVTNHGTLLFNGREFTSPSTAALAACGTTTNGWLAWYAGDATPTHLAQLRAQLLSR
jgi:hypothetical protein